jgi:hypothetical protein
MLGDLSLTAPQGLYQVRCSSLSSSVPYALNTLKREQHTKSQGPMIAADGVRPMAAFRLNTHRFFKRSSGHFLPFSGIVQFPTHSVESGIMKPLQMAGQPISHPGHPLTLPGIGSQIFQLMRIQA